MPDDPFYKDHWITIDDERLDRYQRMFEWNPDSAVLYEAAGIRAGQIIAEFGCGPGHTAVEIANWVGSEGHVHALDINTAFIALTRQNAEKAGVGDRITAHRSDGSELPLPDGSVDRVTTRNTLIYVDDPMTTMAEFKRVLRAGGKMHAIEGDWPMMVVEPVPTTTWQALVSAAAHACRTPEIGRKLTGLMARSGFHDIEVQVITRPDTVGRLLPMIKNLAEFARDSGEMTEAEIDPILATLDRALADNTFLAIAPQFVVTGSR
jgi:ubiquinone/menaquinone biosynthesis C-methylase UbiE